MIEAIQVNQAMQHTSYIPINHQGVYLNASIALTPQTTKMIQETIQ